VSVNSLRAANFVSINLHSFQCDYSPNVIRD
jgi:hypothetical protein